MLLTSFIVRSLASDVCSSPVAYYDGFTINGPCPNHTLVAPVNSNVQYRCDYSINQGALTYWHIIQLSGSPFIIGEAEAPVNNIVINEFYSNSKGYTIIKIPILQEYLNKTLSVQCGLCTFATCANNPLSENISSSDVLIVAFSKGITILIIIFIIRSFVIGNPTSLCVHIVGDDVMLTWLPPVVSIDYAEHIQFDYEIMMSDVLNSSEAAVLVIEESNLNVSELNLTSQGVCTCYSWSVTALIGGRKSERVESNETFTLSSGI